MLEKYATWSDIKKMTINDVDLMNIALDEWKRAERAASKGK